MSSAGHYTDFNGGPPLSELNKSIEEFIQLGKKQRQMDDLTKAIGLTDLIRGEENARDRVNPRTLLEVAMEYTRAISLHGHFHSLHDGYGVMAEEFDEFWDEIKARHPDRSKLKEEAIQLAAMCLKFVDDFCTDEQIANETGHAAPKRDD